MFYVLLISLPGVFGYYSIMKQHRDIKDCYSSPLLSDYLLVRHFFSWGINNYFFSLGLRGSLPAKRSIPCQFNTFSAPWLHFFQKSGPTSEAKSAADMVLEKKPKKPEVYEMWHLKVFDIQVWPELTTNEPVDELSEPLPADPEVVVRSHLLLLSFTSRMRSVETEHAHHPLLTSLPHYSELFRPTCIIILKLITWDAILNFSTALRARPWLPPLRDRVLASWSPMGLGVFFRRGKPLVLEGELVMSSRKNGKRTPRTLDGAGGQPERGRLAWPLVVFWHTPFWGGPLCLRHRVSGGLAVPRMGDSSAGGVPGWSLVRPTVEEPPLLGKTRRKHKKRKRAGPKWNPSVKIIYSNP